MRVPLVFLMLSLASCSHPAPLADAYPSADALAAEVLQALAARDRARLEALAVTECEFRDHIWDYLPAARPERNLPISYVWGELHQKSAGTLMQTLARHGGRRYQLGSVTFGGETDYGPYRVHRAAAFHVRDAAGEPTVIRVIGSMLEKDGAWKVFSYVVDE